MKIEEIKNLKQLDVIIKAVHKTEIITVYEIYYVLFNFKKTERIEVCQGYYEYNKNQHILLENTRQDIDYEQLVLYFDLIHKNEKKPH